MSSGKSCPVVQDKQILCKGQVPFQLAHLSGMLSFRQLALTAGLNNGTAKNMFLCYRSLHSLKYHVNKCKIASLTLVPPLATLLVLSVQRGLTCMFWMRIQFCSQLETL